MPAAAVIPAPLAYTIIVAVKRLVVGLNAKFKNANTIIFKFLSLRLPIARVCLTHTSIGNRSTNFSALNHFFYE